MMMLDYKGGRGVKNLGKSDYIISECSPKSDDECFFFRLKSSFRSQDIFIFVFTF